MALKISGALDDGNGLVHLQVQSDGSIKVPVDTEDDTVPVAPTPVTTDELVRCGPSDTTPGYLNTKLTTNPAHITKGTVNASANESIALTLPSVGTAGTVGGSGTFIESITTDSQGRVTAKVAATPGGGGGGGLPTGYENIGSAGALSLTLGHSDIEMASGDQVVTLADHTVADYVKTVTNASFSWNVYINLRFRFGGHNSVGTDGRINLPPLCSVMLMWNAGLGRYIVKQLSSNSTTNVFPETDPFS